MRVILEIFIHAEDALENSDYFGLKDRNLYAQVFIKRELRKRGIIRNVNDQTHARMAVGIFTAVGIAM